MKAPRLLLIACCLSLTACATRPGLVSDPASDPVAEIMTHDQAREVARHYPDFFTKALNKIAALHHDLNQALSDKH
jgi:hypothetical protein